jgi:galactitol-specific phosphotransferase system IIB component
MQRLKYKYIAIDFDGTIATDSYPELGTLLPKADFVLRKICIYGGKIAIWTCRSGPDENKVKKFLADNNIPYDHFNEPFPEIEALYANDLGITSRKVCADLYIDNKDIHCIGNGGINWNWIHDQIFEEYFTESLSPKMESSSGRDFPI